MAEDYYKSLGVSRDAPAAEIQKAYRSLARKYHPDVNPDDATAKKKFQEIQKAYEVLNDSEKRALYDRYGSDFEQMASGAAQGGPRSGPYGGPGGASFNEVDFEQLFGGGASPFADIFGQFGGGTAGRRTARRPQRGTDLLHTLTISFQTAILGGEARLTVQRPSGKAETITVKIPAGIESGKSIRLRGQGNTSATGGPAGDLLIKVQVTPHPHYQRRGQDLEIHLPITLGEAVFGGKIDVPTPRGEISLTVPPGTSSGKRLRVKGHGIKTPTASGDLYVEVSIALPGKLSERTKQLVKEIEDENAFQPRKDISW